MFTKVIFFVKGIEDRDWREVKKHFFTHLGNNAYRYVNPQQEIKLVDKLANAKYGEEEDIEVEMMDLDEYEIGDENVVSEFKK